jgi:predicted RNA-binding protein associated with RNAse of E/G family
LSEVEIHYTRPPGRLTVFRQHVVERTAECVVTLLDEVDIPRPLTADGHTILEPGAPVVWFTFPGLWHDIGRFHTRAGRFTGFYANILTPVAFVTPTCWETTDLFLDVWLDDRGATLLDADELAAAVHSGAVSRVDASRARIEADALIRAAGAGGWPPGVCQRWPLERARAAVHGDGTQGGAAV